MVGVRAGGDPQAAARRDREDIFASVRRRPVSATELRFILRRFPLIRTLRVRCLGPTVLPGAPREERAEDRYHKRPGGGGGGGVRAGGGGGGVQVGGSGSEAGGGETQAGGAWAAAVGGGEPRNDSPNAAAITPPSAAAAASPISDQQILDGSAIVRLLSLNTPLQIQQVAGTQVEYLSICNCGEFEVHQGLRDYLTHTIATWGRSIRHIEMHDPLPLADEFWKCVEGHPMLSKVTVYKCTHLTDRFVRHVARCGALKELSIASCPNVSGGGFAELAEKCPGLEGMVLEDLSLSVVAKKARRAPGAGRAGGRGVGEGALEAERIRGGEGESAGGGAGEDVRMGEGGGEAERGAGGMEGGEGREGDMAQEGVGRAGEGNGEVTANEADGWDGAMRLSGEAEGEAAGKGGSLAASFPNLSSLKLINCALDAHWLEMFAGQLAALRRLTVMACPDPLDRFFLTAARTAARLESVEIVDCEGVSDRGIVALLNGCPTINSLTLSGCEGGQVDGGGEGGGGRRGGRGGGGDGGGEGSGAARVTDESLRAVVVHGVGLRSLQLKWSPGFTGLHLARDVLDARRLHLEGLDGLSDSFLLLAAATLPRLSTIAVEYCREISEAGLNPLVRSCHRLQHMCFSGFRTTHLSDLLLHTIASHCPLLTTLTLRASPPALISFPSQRSSPLHALSPHRNAPHSSFASPRPHTPRSPLLSASPSLLKFLQHNPWFPAPSCLVCDDGH
ncbi:unnamed protein product [Closterium sp. Naga37s-1]|nr:unnamed protein product [Closterium sp. Naga37s-1]